MSRDKKLIEARGISMRYSKTRRSRESWALHDVDVELLSGRALGIIGESGSGKSTLLRILLGLQTPASGHVSITSRSVNAQASAKSLHWLRRLTGVVFQDPYSSLDPRMRVGKIVAEPLWALKIPGDHQQRVADVLIQVGLEPDTAEKYPHQFSGGQRQRIALARAIVHRPKILFGDEPFSALDITRRASIIELLRKLKREQAMSMVLVSHDIPVVQELCDDVLVMSNGRVVEEGPTEQVFLAPRVAATRRLLAAIPTLPITHREKDFDRDLGDNFFSR